MATKHTSTCILCGVEVIVPYAADCRTQGSEDLICGRCRQVRAKEDAPNVRGEMLTVMSLHARTRGTTVHIADARPGGYKTLCGLTYGDTAATVSRSGRLGEPSCSTCLRARQRRDAQASRLLALGV